MGSSGLVVRPEFRPAFEREGVRTVADAVAKWAPGEPSPDERSVVAEVRAGEHRLFVKRYAYRGAWRLRTWLVTPRVRREFENLEGLARFGLKVPTPVAWGVERRGGLLAESVLVTEAIPGAIDLRDLSVHPERCPFPPPDARERRTLIEDFARALRRAHDAGWFVHTLFFKNLLLTRGPGGCALWVIDVPFAHIWRNRLMPGRARVRDFATLAKGALKLLSRSERRRFAVAYGRADKAFLRAVDAYRRRHYPGDAEK